MVRRLGLLLVVVGALAVASSALAGYPTPFAVQGGTGVLSKDGSLRFLASKAGTNTALTWIKTADQSVARSRTVAGAFGVPQITQNGLNGGLFHDGTALVLQSVGQHATTKFLVIAADDLGTRAAIGLKGTFGFDALSPDGSKLYLIQHMSTDDLQRYVVRAYDLKAHKLAPGRIADRTQKSWIMQGFAVNRATSEDGRWVYTLYMNPGGYPFVHALDTVGGKAHCVGLPWMSADQSPVMSFQLSLKNRSLVVRYQGGQLYRVIDTKTWRLSKTVS
jgi:hypothetical protein